MTEKTREELEAEIAALRAKDTTASAPALSTRDRSPVKPQDHKSPADDVHELEFVGVKVRVQARMLNDWRLQRMIGRSQAGDMDAPARILDFLIGPDKHDAIIDALVERDGWCDENAIGDITKQLFEELKAGN